jgi:hypothetical protein
MTFGFVLRQMILPELISLNSLYLARRPCTLTASLRLCVFPKTAARRKPVTSKAGTQAYLLHQQVDIPRTILLKDDRRLAMAIAGV